MSLGRRGGFVPARRGIAWAAALITLCVGCGAGERSDGGGPAPGDTAVASRPRATPNASVPGDLVAVCAVERIDPDRLVLTVSWSGGHLHVAGLVREGAGKTLNLVLTRRAKFVFDEVFKGERLGSFTLATDSVEATSVAYTPTPAEQAAFDRRESLKLDPSERLCLDVSLYDKLNLLAIRHIEVPPRGTGRPE